ncbi:MAG TPA: hypothetical protein PLY95_01460, partial [Candidatus Paceibacterota bacterium]|nr:hypothetical protein [Candidatus Paceibacterota bacterium]HQI25904.1 hypothetical protein [Candidatus Paceibacterota bacterium]
MNKKLWLKLILVVVAICALFGAFLIGVYYGYEKRPEVEKVSGLVNKEPGETAEVDFAPFWKAWNIVNEKYLMENGT